MTPEGLIAFGNHVREARVLKGWTLEALAQAALNNPDRKGYVSQIENGKRPLSARTIGNLARVLDLPAAVTRPLLFAPAPEDEVTREDRLAETLIRKNTAEPAPPQAEALVIALAYEFAGGKFLELSTAYTGLRNALQAAADMRAELERLHNLDDRLAAVLRRVADLNDKGLREEAGQALEAAIKAKEAELEALQDAALTQDRLRYDPAAAAKRLVARLKASAPPGGVFMATHNLIAETLERGKGQGDPFDLAVSLQLALLNLDRANRSQQPMAQDDLSQCHFGVGERKSGIGHFQSALSASLEALKKTSHQADRRNWAAIQNNLGNVLTRLGERARDKGLLQKAIAAHQAALSCRSPRGNSFEWAASQSNLGTALQELGELTFDSEPLHQSLTANQHAISVCDPLDQPKLWADTHNNLGLTLRWLGTVNQKAGFMTEAVAAFTEALKLHTREGAPFAWAKVQWNLADLALAHHAIAPDPLLLGTARHHLALAREVFAEAESTHQLAECDRLQALIDAASVGPSPDSDATNPLPNP